MKKLTVIAAIILQTLSTAYGQTIEIGQNANSVKQLIEWSTRQRTGYDSYGNSKGNNVVWDTKYYNGQISEVIQCYSQQYLIDFRTVADFCKHYIMENGKLAYILTQYENISVSKLKEFYDRSYSSTKAGDLYFSDDYKNYSKIYLHQNGLATVKWTTAKQSDLPEKIRSEIKRKQEAEAKAEQQRVLAEKKEKDKEREIKSKVYDLKQYAPDEYKDALSRQRDRIVNYFMKNSSDYYSRGNFPSFRDLEQRDVKFERFKNTYTVSYALEDHSRPSVNYGSYIAAGSNDIRGTQQVKLIDGTDQSCSLLKSNSIRLSTIKIEGYEVMTKATFENIKVDFTRGLTVVKIKGGEVEFTKFPPEQDLQSVIIDNLSDKPKGKYIVKYEIGNILGKEITNIQVQ
ncbi:MAG: hypothetical protein M9888_11105 [Chitinophagales bacterium]|nr:hypothetical protein [Chitinophagales bacterium]